MALSNQPVIIIKKKKKGGHHAHHGGAWKLAYADFVTAMMAFFLLLWLLNVTTDEQKRGIADYFDPASVARSTSGSGGVLGGLSISTPGAQSSPNARFSLERSMPGLPEPVADSDTIDSGASEEVREDANRLAERQERPDDRQPGQADEAELRAELADIEQQKFDEAAEALREAIRETPELKDLEQNLLIDKTPEGLRIQIVDQQRYSMFPTGSAEMFDQTRKLLGLVAQVVSRLPNPVSISGHTDATPYAAGARYDNWELSADRANASRRALVDAGVDPSRIARVVGLADTEPLLPEDTFNPENRRISVVLLRDAPGSMAE